MNMYLVGCIVLFLAVVGLVAMLFRSRRKRAQRTITYTDHILKMTRTHNYELKKQKVTINEKKSKIGLLNDNIKDMEKNIDVLNGYISGKDSHIDKLDKTILTHLDTVGRLTIKKKNLQETINRLNQQRDVDKKRLAKTEGLNFEQQASLLSKDKTIEDMQNSYDALHEEYDKTKKTMEKTLFVNSALITSKETMRKQLKNLKKGSGKNTLGKQGEDGVASNYPKAPWQQVADKWDGKERDIDAFGKEPF
jgi:chromosome segregation ATPase